MTEIKRNWLYRNFGKEGDPGKLDWVLIVIMTVVAMAFIAAVYIVV